MARVDAIERVVAPVVESSGLELVDVEQGPGRLKLTVDREGGVDLDVISALTTKVSHALDQADAVPGGRYELEVSSPGVERRLRTPEHFRRFVGHDIAVRTVSGTEGERRVHGRLAEVAEHEFTIEGIELPEGRRTIRYRDVERAHTVFDWRAALAGTPVPNARRDERNQHRSQQKKGKAPGARVPTGRAERTETP